jgi:23S rRNA (uridine2552-2'-O)-methyltransferase
MAHHRNTDRRSRQGAKKPGYDRHDAYWAQARDEGYAARSVYKLQQVDGDCQLLRPGVHVLDLGCAPGSWLQYAGERVGTQGQVVGVDLEKVMLALPRNVVTLQQDMATLSPNTLPPGFAPVDVILSDAAPHTTGIRQVDQDRAFDLSARAVRMSDRLLKHGGSLLVKTFQGPDTKRLLDGARKRFEEARFVRPAATRRESFELYLLARRYRGPPPEDQDPLAVL